MDEESIFHLALEKVGSERAAILAENCAGDDECRRRVEVLIEAHENTRGFLLDTPPAGLNVAVDQPVSEHPGAIIGPYKLLQQIGEGGMGVVFMAEQTEPLQRTVALKIIKPGMDTRQVIARFEAERQAVAMMDHPNIAKVLDAGATESGRPYFVMELVKGVPITKYCDEKQLPLRARLELFTQVCQAVQHAHQKGIIHRDLKPNNVLVAEYDNRAVPKVIDFGVAKATAHRLTERTMFTEFGQVLGTMEYMSPEQAKLNQLDVDTRSDIYSLGVLLYELLTGSTPFEGKRLHEAAFVEMLRIIREEEPPKPSTRLSTMDQLPNVAANRGLEPNKLGGCVKGELDWIVMKALEKDRNRRYESASAFAVDVERHLHDETVTAGPPSATYRFRKFSRRNRLALTTGSLVAAALLLGTAVSTWQAIRAEKARSAETVQREVADRQRVEAQKQRGLAEANLQKARQAVDEYFTLVSESRLLDVPGMQPLRQELLEAALRYYQTMLDEQANDPAVLADLAMAQLRTANVYHELGRVNDALSAVDSALEHVERLRQDYPDAVEHRRRLAGFWNVRRHASSSNETIKDLAAAHRTLVRFLQVWEALARENPSVEAFQNDLASINLLLSLLEATSGAAGEVAGFTRAALYANKAIALWEQLRQAHPERPNYRENLAFAYNELSYALKRAGEQDAAREAAGRSAALRETLIAESPNLPTYRELAAGKLSSVAAGLAPKDPQEAEAAYRRAVETWQKLATDFPAAPQYVIELSSVQGELVELLAGPLKRPDEAIEMSRELVDLLAIQVAENPKAPSLRRDVALTRRTLANRLLASKEGWSEAEDLHLQSLADFKKLSDEFPEEPQHVEQAGHSYRYLGWIARDLGRLDDAADYFEQGAAAFRKLAEGKAPSKYAFYRDYQADSQIELALVSATDKKLEAAEAAARQGAEIYESLLRDHPENADYRQKTSRALRVLGDLLREMGKDDQALASQTYPMHGSAADGFTTSARNGRSRRLTSQRPLSCSPSPGKHGPAVRFPIFIGSNGSPRSRTSPRPSTLALTCT